MQEFPQIPRQVIVPVGQQFDIIEMIIFYQLFHEIKCTRVQHLKKNL